VLAADTVVAVGRRLLAKPEDEADAGRMLGLLSGRAHRVLTAVALVAPDGREAARLSETRVRFKRLTRAEIDSYLASAEWTGKAGGYGVQGRAGAFVIDINGAYTGVVGLPLYETRALLVGLGYPAA
jgi:septum formation protein